MLPCNPLYILHTAYTAHVAYTAHTAYNVHTAYTRVRIRQVSAAKGVVNVNRTTQNLNAAPPVQSILQWIGNDFKEFAFNCGSAKIARDILREKSYRTFEIPKKGTSETRTIEAPIGQLKTLQKLALKALEILKPDKAAHGFVKGKNNATAASEVARKIGIAKATVIGQDLRKAFPTITRDRVREIWREVFPNLSGWQLHVLGRICCRNGVLATGSPASPHILNLAARKLDLEMRSWTQNNGGIFLRYADDCVLVIYTHNSKRIRKARLALKRAIKRNGFIAHPEKTYATKIGVNSPAAEVVGAQVKPSEVKSRKKYRRKIRALAHQYRRRLKARRENHEEGQRNSFNLRNLYARIKGLASYSFYLTTKPIATKKRDENSLLTGTQICITFKCLEPRRKTGGNVRALMLRTRQETSGCYVEFG